MENGKFITAEMKGRGVEVKAKGTNKDLMHIFDAIVTGLLKSSMPKELMLMIILDAKKED